MLLGTGYGLGTGLSGCGSAGAPAPDPGTDSRIRSAATSMPALARALMGKTGVPGLSMAIVHQGRTILAEGFGVCEAGGRAAVDPDTAFLLASVSKPLGATVVARQVGEGNVKWDTPMRELLPWFRLGTADATERVTVADLYAHRSGLPDHAGDDLEEMGWPQREVLERLRLQPLQPLRTHYAYTNEGLTAAAIGVAGRAGAEWAELSRRTLYEPLGMKRTTSRNEEFVRQSNRAVGHIQTRQGWVAGEQRNADPQSPAGGASSSAQDMALWLQLLLAKGRWNGKSLVDSNALEAAMSPQAPGGGYGFGFNVGTLGDNGPRMLSHSGAFQLGAATCFMMVPEFDAAIVVLTNGWPIGVPETLCRQFMDLAQTGSVSRDWWSAYHERISMLIRPEGSLVGVARPTSPVAAKPIGEYAGQYVSDYFGAMQIDVQEGANLRMALGPLPQYYPLQHWSGDDFIFFPGNESAAPGSVSLARFDLNAGTVWLEFYDANGLGRFKRA